MYKKLIYILLALIIFLIIIYVIMFSSILTGKAITNCEKPEDLDLYDCNIFNKEIVNKCGEQFYKEGCES